MENTLAKTNTEKPKPKTDKSQEAAKKLADTLKVRWVKPQKESRLKLEIFHNGDWVRIPVVNLFEDE